MRWEDVALISADWRYMVSKTRYLNKSKHIVPILFSLVGKVLALE